MSKVLFLDIDGVLIPLGKENHKREPNPQCRDRINRIAQHCDSVVLSSSWRVNATDPLREKGMCFSEWKGSPEWQSLRVRLERDLGIRIDEPTPDLSLWDPDVGHYRISVGDRALEIQQWLQAHPEVSEWVCLEDTPDWIKGLDPEHVVLCDSDTGISEKDTEHALRILGFGPEIFA